MIFLLLLITINNKRGVQGQIVGFSIGIETRRKVRGHDDKVVGQMDLAVAHHGVGSGGEVRLALGRGR